DDIHLHEKRIDVFSSHQPDGLMTQLMGTNMMRKDGAAHLEERKALFPALSPKTVMQHWKAQFVTAAQAILDDLTPKGACDLMAEFAMPLSAEALKAITGLIEMPASRMDAVSQAMIDGCANYAGDPAVEARCNAATAEIDDHISRMWKAPPDTSALAVMQDAGMPEDSIRANIKLIISGGQNEPRDAIAGTMAALLEHPAELDKVLAGDATWAQAFGEYGRWMAPIGMSPRRVARNEQIGDITLSPEDRVFFMFGSAGRDETHFEAADQFQVTRNTQPAITFGAGPHFCAGAAAARCLIVDVALPMLVAACPNLRLTAPVTYAGWAFRGPLAVHVAWD
ncbi:MAG: cytochrome P450, partial [Rhodobacteraceae bacterium]|nr:cytochrome P450 [Paracoccaceae bacterium]